MSIKRKMTAAVDTFKQGIWVMILAALAGVITVILVVIMTTTAMLTESLAVIIAVCLMSAVVGIMVLGWTFTRFYKKW